MNNVDSYRHWQQPYLPWQSIRLHPYPHYVTSYPVVYPPPRYSDEAFRASRSGEIQDVGRAPSVVNINQAAKRNDTYRTALWTGEHLQVTVMSIPVGGDIGVEVHPTTDQFIRIEQGQGLVQMGDSKDQLDFRAMAYDDYAIMVPAGKWHNMTNTGDQPLKVYVIYAPPEHPRGTVHVTKADAMAAHD
ncbi:cupin domain-containing protein [Paenibacillus sp. TRM 82003]|nr:cupin domain-containing protein [Paenibacillus sp. TRM 82003]